MWERALYLLVLLGTGCRTPPPLPPKPNQPVASPEGEALPEARPEPESEGAEPPGNSPAAPGEPGDATTPLKHPR